MIVVYPMIVSKAVSENIVPGLVKTVESYIIVNAKDSLLTNKALVKNANFKIKSGKIIATENVNLTEAGEGDWGKRSKPTPAEKIETDRKLEQQRKQEDDMWEAKRQKDLQALKDLQTKRDEETAKRQKKEQENEEAWKKREEELEAQREKFRNKAYDDLEKKRTDKEKLEKQIDADLKKIEDDKIQADKDAADAQRQAAKDERETVKFQQSVEKFESDKKDRARKREIEDRKMEEERVEKEKKEAEKQAEQDAKVGISSIKITDNKALSIEPTTVDVEYSDSYGNRKPYSLGVKVVPFRVKSEAKLSRLIMHDVQLKWFNAKMISIGRRITRRVWGFIDRWAGNLKLGGLIPSGDPRRDIVMSRTGYGGGGYIVLSKSEDIDEAFLNNAKKINRLYKMGWGNIIIVDNVNRMAYFCLKQFRGVCTALSFSMIYHNFKALQVYDSLEDASRQTSSIFKIRKKFSKIIAESIVEYKLEKYLSEDK